ncbi:MAG: aminoacyl-tRNA hydrolase [Planctomycetota bacterium]
MKLVVGLGNPGRQYEGTRHNVGYLVLAEFARRHGAGLPVRNKFRGEVLEFDYRGEKTVLLSPLTYMNLSGLSVAEAKGFYKLENDSLLVVTDDLNLPVARLRFRARGSAGGQKGLENIIQQLGHSDFARLRIGVGTPPPRWNWADYVLAKFTKEEMPQIEKAVQQAADAVGDWIREGIDYCMRTYNGNPASEARPAADAEP